MDEWTKQKVNDVWIYIYVRMYVYTAIHVGRRGCMRMCVLLYGFAGIS